VEGTESVIVNVKDENGVWWESSALTPNSGDYYWDISNHGWEITEAQIYVVSGSLGQPHVGGIYARLP
jgi:hypothetical protein